MERYTRVLMDTSFTFPIHFLKIYSVPSSIPRSLVSPLQVRVPLQGRDLGAITGRAWIGTFGVHEGEPWEALIGQRGAKQRPPATRAYPLPHDPAGGPARRARSPGEHSGHHDHEQQPDQGIAPGLAYQSREDTERLLYTYHCTPLHGALVCMRSSSPGRTGRGQRHSSQPVPTRPPAGLRALSTRSRIATAVVCQPLAARPWKRLSRAAASSRWKGCGSKAAQVVICAVSSRNLPEPHHIAHA
jgi:hypothetical protein